MAVSICIFARDEERRLPACIGALEAAACGVPAVASRIYGITDAVVEGQTGLLHEAGNVREITMALRQLADSPELRARMGEAAQERAGREFSEDRVLGDLLDYYRHAM